MKVTIVSPDEGSPGLESFGGLLCHSGECSSKHVLGKRVGRGLVGLEVDSVRDFSLAHCFKKRRPLTVAKEVLQAHPPLE